MEEVADGMVVVGGEGVWDANTMVPYLVPVREDGGRGGEWRTWMWMYLVLQNLLLSVARHEEIRLCKRGELSIVCANCGIVGQWQYVFPLSRGWGGDSISIYLGTPLDHQ